MKTMREFWQKLMSVQTFVNVCILMFVGSLLWGFANGLWNDMTGANRVPALSSPIRLFNIKPLTPDTGPVWHPDLKVWLMMLPAKDGFASNVNVRIESIGALSFAEYIQISKVQMEEMGWKFISEALDKEKGVWTAEFVGQLNGTRFHWYAKAMVSKGKAYVATATSRPKQWTEVGEKLKACVDSLAPAD